MHNKKKRKKKNVQLQSAAGQKMYTEQYQVAPVPVYSI